MYKGIWSLASFKMCLKFYFSVIIITAEQPSGLWSQGALWGEQRAENLATAN